MKNLLIFFLLSVSINVFAYDIYSDGIYYNKLSQNTVEVTYSTADDSYRYVGSVDVPDKITEMGQDFYVISVGEGAFGGCEKLSSVSIGNNVTSIASRAFADCKSLTTLIIGIKVRTIEQDAFDGCEKLSSIKVDEDNFFYDSRDNCNAIIETETNTLVFGCGKSTIPDGVEKIGSKAFCRLESLKSISIPNSVKTIGSYAFFGCSGLTVLTIPNSVTGIGEAAFYGCSGLTSISIPNNMTKIEGMVFCLCSNLKSLTIPASVTSIGESAFCNCTGLTSLVIPQNVASIGNHAFSGCSNITEIYCFGETPPSCGTAAFGSLYQTATLYLPKNATSSYMNVETFRQFNTIKSFNSSYFRSDVNNDGSTDISDVVAVINVMAQGTNDTSADVNEDKSVDISDVVAVINAMAQGLDIEDVEDVEKYQEADNVWCGYYGDALNTGKGTYVIELYKGEIDDDGYLKSKGYAVTLTINGPLVADGETITLPVGTYKTNLNKNADFKIHNEDYDPYVSFVELWGDGDKKAVTDFISGGTMKITNNNGRYTVECDLDMYYISDNDGKQVADGTIKAIYTGEITVEDKRTGSGTSDLDVEFTADQLWCGYYGDYLGFGKGMYMVEINNGTIDDAGYLTSPGNAITLAVNGEMPAKGKTITLPVGLYSTELEQTDKYKIINEDLGFYLSFVEMMYEGETASYTDFISKGTMTVTNKGNGIFEIFCDLDMFYEDESGNVVEDGNMKGTYTGEISVDDYTGGGGGGEEQKLYETYPYDVDLGEMTECVGSFYKFTKSQLGNYYLSLFNVGVDWEKEEFKGAGQILTIDLFTDYTEKPDLNQLNATFKIAEDGEYEEWTYQPGKVLLDNGEKTWSGTYIDEICELEDEEGKYFGYGRSSMVTGGTIKATSDGTNVTFELELQTETGNKITGKYSGKPEVSVPENSSVDAAKARKIKSANDLMRPFSKYGRNPEKAFSRREPRKIKAHTSRSRLMLKGGRSSIFKRAKSRAGIRGES